ncbi:MAG: hypothetical protein HC927_12375, partial [Deltaproteobacteria bacterium]|nr:hypothetical protein [Deltaproteobacteria bacterium]
AAGAERDSPGSAWTAVTGNEPSRQPRDRRGERGGRGRDRDRDRRQDAQERLNRAARELPPQINRLLASNVSWLGLRARLLFWRARYRLSALDVQRSGRGFEIIAIVNPRRQLAQGYRYDEDQLLDMFNRVANDYFERNPEALSEARERGAELRREGEAAPANMERHASSLLARRKRTSP